MKKRAFILATFGLLMSFYAQSQSINHALRLNGNGSAECASLQNIGNVSNYTVQFLVNPSEWVKDSYILRRGTGSDEFSIKLDNTNNLIMTVGDKNITITDKLAINAWTQISISTSTIGVEIWVDGVKSSQTISNGMIIPSSQSPLIIGERFKGRIDEFRFWNKEINNVDDLCIRNTVDKFHPSFANLVFYYKFDQELCPTIVDNTFAHHATPVNATKEIVTDNDNFKYRVVTGYSSFVRHCDRLQIDRNMHLLTNDLIFLDADVNGTTGEVVMTYPDNQGVLTGGEYKAEYDGHNGVLSLNGIGSGMEVGDELFIKSIPTLAEATFECWLNITKWNEGAHILYSKSEKTGKQIIISLGNEANKEVIVKVDDYTYRINNALKANGWEHFATVFTPNFPKLIGKVKVFNNQKQITNTTYTAGTSFTIFSIKGNSIIGKDFSGYIDAAMIFGRDRSGMLANDAAEMGNDFKFPGGGDGAISLLSYWKFDDPENPGKDTKGWKSMISEIREKMYKGYRGYKIRIGLVSSESINGNKTWVSNISKPEWRANLVAGVKELLPYCDGIDVDFEWLYAGDSRWETGYGPMVEQLRAIIDPASKVYSVSLHPVAYQLPKKYINIPDYYTFQIYGPSVTYFYYDNYVKAYNNFINWGYPKEKIGMSYPTTATTGAAGGVTGYKNIVGANPNLSPDANEAQMNNVKYIFNGVTCVKDKMKFILDKNAGTVMYFDMGNDITVSEDLSLIKAAHSVISANVDTLVTKADPSSVALVIDKNDSIKYSKLSYSENAREISVNCIANAELKSLSLISINGTTVRQEKVSGSNYTMLTDSITAGIYVARVETTKGTDIFKVKINNK